MNLTGLNREEAIGGPASRREMQARTGRSPLAGLQVGGNRRPEPGEGRR